MKLVRAIYPVLVAVLIVLAAAVPVFAAGIVIDGNFGDWAGKASVVDTGGADDERTPSRADINEFRADATSTGLYLLKAWDDTNFTGGQETTAGITVQTAGGAYYRIYTTAQGKSDPPVPLSSLVIMRCTDAACTKRSNVCQGKNCQDALVGSSTTWQDPFAETRKQAPDCSGTNCGKYDTAVELYIPWDLVGGTPGDKQTIFLNFGSYPSGPAQAPKDDAGRSIACQNEDGVFRCFPVNPTAVTLSSFGARADAAPDALMGWMSLAMIGLVVVGGALVWQARRRAA